MTDDQFDVLDELYFVQSFDQLLHLTGKPANELIPVLVEIYQNDWIKVMGTVDEELTPDQVDLENSAEEYFFLATKKGLLAHNS